MGKLRDQMVSDLRLRNYSPSTIRIYTGCIYQFVKHFRRSVDLIGEHEIRAYLLYLLDERKASPALRKMFVAAIKFFYRVTLNRPQEVERIPYPKVPKALPDVLTHEEVMAIIDGVDSIKYRTIIAVAYAAGLRITEACGLHSRGDIDSNRMLIHVRAGKGGKDRYVMLSERLLVMLRDYWKQASPKGLYLFPGSHPDRPTTPASVYTVFKKALKKTGITKHVTLHTMRHCFATHLLEAHTDTRVIQALLGHASSRTTSRYTHVSAHLISRIKSPFDSVGLEKESPAV
jgi:integrase/recombinase XerD